jgi:membrane fusion protein, macrolide-specific efflux system
MTPLPIGTAAAERSATEPRRRSAHLLWPLGLLALALAVAGFVWQRQQNAPSTGVALATATQRDIEDAVTALGKLQPRDYVDVGAQVSGQLMSIAVRAGDRVKVGALLAEIDPQLQLAKLELDRAQLAQLKADRRVQKLMVELATAQFERQLELKGKGATHAEMFDQKRSEMRVSTARLASIDAQIRQVRSVTKADEAQLGYTRIYAPMTGTVLSVDARAGQTLIASQQAPVLLRIADLSKMTVFAQVSEADITRLVPGMDVYFTTLGHAERRWHGKLRQVLPAPTKATPSAPNAPSAAQVVTYVALFDVDNEGGELRPEMSAQVFFVVEHAAAAVVVPASALQDASAKETQLTVELPDGRRETRNVKLGVRNRFDAQVIAGLRAGERVVERVMERVMERVIDEAETAGSSP